jgi:hypothetical protein
VLQSLTAHHRNIQGEFSFDGCNAEGQLWSSAVDVNVGNLTFIDRISGKAHLAESVTAVAVEGKKDYSHSRHIFVAHRWLNETRVLDKVNGSLVNTIPMHEPNALTFGTLGSPGFLSVFVSSFSFWIVRPSEAPVPIEAMLMLASLVHFHTVHCEARFARLARALLDRERMAFEHHQQQRYQQAGGAHVRLPLFFLAPPIT